MMIKEANRGHKIITAYNEGQQRQRRRTKKSYNDSSGRVHRTMTMCKSRCRYMRTAVVERYLITRDGVGITYTAKTWYDRYKRW